MRLAVIIALLISLLAADDRDPIKYDFGVNLTEESSYIRGSVTVKPYFVTSRATHMPFYVGRIDITSADNQSKKYGYNSLGYRYGYKHKHIFSIYATDDNVLGETTYDLTYEYIKPFYVKSDTSTWLKKYLIVNAGWESGGCIFRDEYKWWYSMARTGINAQLISYIIDYKKKETKQTTLVELNFHNRSNFGSMPWEMYAKLRVQPYEHIYAEGMIDQLGSYRLVAGLTGSL